MTGLHNGTGQESEFKCSVTENWMFDPRQYLFLTIFKLSRWKIGNTCVFKCSKVFQIVYFHLKWQKHNTNINPDSDFTIVTNF